MASPWRPTRTLRRARPAGRDQRHRQALGISTGTVDRALHGKPEVSRQRARAFSAWRRRSATARISRPATSSPESSCALRSICPGRIALFWDSLREGIREAAAPFGPALHVDFHAYPRLGEGDIPLFEQALVTASTASSSRPETRRPRAASRESRATTDSGRLCRDRRARESPTRRRSRLTRSPSAQSRENCWRDSCRAAARWHSSPAGSRCRNTRTSCAASRRVCEPPASGSPSVLSSRPTTTNGRRIGAH